MNVIRNIRTPIMHRAVEANGFVFVGGTIADDTSASMGEQTRNILGKIAGYLKEAGTDTSRVVSASIFVTDLSKKPRNQESRARPRLPAAGPAVSRGHAGPRRPGLGRRMVSMINNADERSAGTLGIGRSA